MAWKQTDWSGGPGQAQWLDRTMYSSSSRIDSVSVPGALRLSFLSGPYTKDTSNPVIPKGGAGAWDERYVIGSPGIRSTGGYEFLYTGTDAGFIDAIGYADSTDGVQWNKDAGNPVLKISGTEPWDQNGVKMGSLVKDGDIYHLFFYGNSAAGADSIGHATSTDLKHWSRSAAPVLSPGPAGSWDESGISCVTVLKVGGTFNMWYQAHTPGGIGRIGHATSPDGNAWTKDTANPVMSPGTPGSFDDISILSFRLIKRPLFDDYLLAYCGSTMPIAFGIGIATSPDGVTWTKDAGNPKFTTESPNWFSDSIEPGDLTFDGSVYKLQFFGADSFHRHSTGEAWSEDGITWQANPANPLIGPSPAPAWDSAAAEAGHAFVEGSALRVFYQGYPPMPCYTIGTATATPSYNASGTLTSSVYDALSQVGWGSMRWEEEKPAGTGVRVDVRAGNTPTPGASWSAWTTLGNGATVPFEPSRYLQYRATLSTTAAGVSPEFREISFKPGRSWYLAEGSTGANEQGSFETWVLVQNPGDEKAEVDIFYQTPKGEKQGPHLTVEARTRRTVNVADTVPGEWSVSTRVTSDKPVIAERSMYWTSAAGVFRQAAHDSIGSDP